MTKKEYLNLALLQDVEWLKAVSKDPGPHMRPIHVLLLRLAIRMKEGR